MSENEPETEQPFEEQPPELEPDEVEQEEEAEEAETPPEPEPEPEPEARADEDRVQTAKKIDRSFKTYQSAVERNIGEDVTDWLLCPLCGPGMAPGFVNRHDLGHVPDEVQANVQMFLGFAREQEYEQNPNTHTCPSCKGKTKVKTGAVAGEFITIKCPTCSGYGYEPPPRPAGQTPVANGQQPGDSAVSPDDFETPDRDNWGEPRVLPDGTLNDNYGKQPQFKTRHPVYGETRLLTAEELVSG